MLLWRLNCKGGYKWFCSTKCSIQQGVNRSAAPSWKWNHLLASDVRITSSYSESTNFQAPSNPNSIRFCAYLTRRTSCQRALLVENRFEEKYIPHLSWPARTPLLSYQDGKRQTTWCNQGNLRENRVSRCPATIKSSIRLAWLVISRSSVRLRWVALFTPEMFSQAQAREQLERLAHFASSTPFVETARGSIYATSGSTMIPDRRVAVILNPIEDCSSKS